MDTSNRMENTELSLIQLEESNNSQLMTSRAWTIKKKQGIRRFLTQSVPRSAKEMEKHPGVRFTPK
jgi:hypothetical protein